MSRSGTDHQWRSRLIALVIRSEIARCDALDAGRRGQATLCLDVRQRAARGIDREARDLAAGGVQGIEKAAVAGEREIGRRASGDRCDGLLEYELTGARVPVSAQSVRARIGNESEAAVVDDDPTARSLPGDRSATLRALPG